MDCTVALLWCPFSQLALTDQDMRNKIFSMRAKDRSGRLLVLVVILLFTKVGFSLESGSVLTVGASCQLVADLVKNIGGKRISVVIFPAWQNVKAVFWLGQDLEPKVAIHLSKVVDLSKESLLGYIPRIDGNPYEFFDPVAVKNFVYRVAKLLKELDPEGGGYYQKNLARYSIAIDGVFRNGRWTMSRYNRIVYTLSPHFSYLLKGIGLKEVRVSAEEVQSVRGVIVDDPDNPLRVPLGKESLVVKLYSDLTPDITSYLGLVKENILILSLAFSQVANKIER